MKQYYYRNNKCTAANYDAVDCICWHDIGTGPFPLISETSIHLGIREKPTIAIPAEDEYMCPNCCTPFKCNGPHILESEMNITFNIEAAKIGDKIELLHLGAWLSARYAGSRSDGGIICEDRHMSLHVKSRLEVRIAPKPPVVMWVQLWQSGTECAIRCTNVYKTPDMAVKAAKGYSFDHLVGEPLQVLVPAKYIKS